MRFVMVKLKKVVSKILIFMMLVTSFAFMNTYDVAMATLVPVDTVQPPTNKDIGSISSVPNESVDVQAVSRILEDCFGTYTTPPVKVEIGGMGQGPIMGNGDIGVMVGGDTSTEKFYISKVDFITDDLSSSSENDPSPVALGGITVRKTSGNSTGTYNLTQNILNAEVTGILDNGIKTRAYTADGENTFIVEMWTNNATAINVAVDTWTKSSDPSYPATAGVDGSTLWATRETKSGGRWVSRAAIATKILGTTYTTSSSGATATASFTLNPGTTVKIVSNIGGGGQNPTNHLTNAKTRVSQIDAEKAKALLANHRNWWNQYWAKSYVELNDDKLEKYYYGALYMLACASRETSPVAPGLYGVWINTDGPAWHSDLHLNYNAEAPYYGIYSANRSDLCLPFVQAIIDFIPQGQEKARTELGRIDSSLDGRVADGVLYPCSLSAWATLPENGIYMKQMSNANFAAQPSMMYYNHTLDNTFLSEKAYPFAKLCMDFWEDILVDDGSRYTLYDGGHENEWGFNPGYTLGQIKYAAEFCLKASKTLGIDSDRRAKWQDIVDRLAAYPTYNYNGTTIYPDYEGKLGYAPNGVAANVMHLAAFNSITLDSSESARQIAINTLDANGAWYETCNFSIMLPAAAKVGYNGLALLSRFIECIDEQLKRNLVINDGGHGIEKASCVMMINDMLMQSTGNTIRFFPVWPQSKDAKFTKLRAEGAFLVDGELRDGVITSASIYSEKGTTCTIKNPWPGKTVRIFNDGTEVQATISGENYTFNTTAGQIYTLLPPTTTQVTYLSDLTWTFCSNDFGPVEKNKSVNELGANDGNTITINGITYDKGLGCHANSTITYDLTDLGYTRFKSDIGVDDEVASSSAASIVFQVLLDGVKVYDSGTMGATTDIKSIDLDITNANELKLQVRDANNGITSDHGDWARARLVKDSNVSIPAPTTTDTHIVGSTNLLQGKRATTSAVFDDLWKMTDSSTDTWGFADSYPNNGLQWVKFDLGKGYNLNRIKLWHFFEDARTYNDVIVQVSNDESFKSGVTTVFNNDTNNSALQGTGTDSAYAETSTGKTITFTPVNARYIRLWSNGSSANNSNHYAEVEAYDSN